MNARPRPLLLSTLLCALLAAPATLLAQDTDAELVAEASVPRERLVERYTELAGSDLAAGDLVDDLRGGGDFVVVEEVETTITNPDGTTTTTTELVERTVVNPNGPMGWGEVNITLSMAQALVDGGVYPDLQSALTGLETTVTNPDGTVMTTVEGGVLALRADGMGWGAIAKELGYNLGSLVSASNRGERVDAATAGKANGRSTTAGKPDRIARADRPERPVKPDRIDRPQRPDRPERPQKPERGGRP